MAFSRCQRILVRAAAAALALGVTVSSAALAKPSKPGRPGGFRLLANAVQIFTANRVQCRIFSDGQICATGSSTVGGGIWPRGTADQYVFGSGINIAGVIAPGDRSVNGFAGDTAGGFFNNTSGTNNGTEVRPIFNSNDPDDVDDLAGRGQGAAGRRHREPLRPHPARSRRGLPGRPLVRVVGR